jgi:phage-related protein (TIGR01555 family)
MTGGRIRSVRFKDGYTVDGLSAAIGAASNPYARAGGQGAILPGIFTHQLAIGAYMASGMMRKVIAIPAEDRVREWRDWQADADQITAIEAEEKRLDLIAKVQEAETLRGVGGGALVIITAGNHDQELKPEQIGPGSIVAINVVSRWEITGKDWIKDLASPRHGQPRMWEVSGGNGKDAAKNIHPSRVICFRGPRLPAGATISDEEKFWGDSRLLRVYTEVCRSDETQGWFAALVRKAKLLRFGIPDLDDRDQDQLDKRIAVIAQGENSLNATVFRSSGGADDPGETITDYQVTWAGIPAMMDAFDQRVSAVSDIPFTRLMGRSPAGMNATGAYDDLNWVKTVTTGQKLETRPCLETLDPFLLRSAGVDPAKVTWAFAPLSVPTEKETADTFKTTMDAVEKVQATGAIPEQAFSEGFQNLMIEREYMPGLEQALKKIPENERYGISPDGDGTDPSALQATETDNGGKEADPTSPTARMPSVSRASARAANDGKQTGAE